MILKNFEVNIASRYEREKYKKFYSSFLRSRMKDKKYQK